MPETFGKKHQMKVNVANLPNVVCNSCKCPYFNQVYLVKKLSAFQSPNGQESLIYAPAYICIQCNLPAGIEKTTIDSKSKGP